MGGSWSGMGEGEAWVSGEGVGMGAILGVGVVRGLRFERSCGVRRILTC